MAKQSFLDPVVIARLGNLQLRARRILDGLYSGHHLNLNRGQSQDFSEHRAYNPGDDPRGLDWKIFGRTERLVVKQYEEQTNIGATVILDDSASMSFASEGRISKLEYAKTLAAAMGYLVVSQHDAIGFVGRRQRLPLGSHRGHLDRFFETLESVTPGGTWDAAATLAQATGSLKKRGFALVFSDLQEDPEALIAGLRGLHARKHEVLVFQVLDPAEKDLPYDGPVLFEDLESGQTLLTDPAAIRDAYRTWVNARLAYFTHAFRNAGLDYVCLTTDLPFEKGLGPFLSWREARL